MSDDKKKFSKLVLEERYNQELEMKVQEFLSDKVIVDESEYAALKRENDGLRQEIIKVTVFYSKQMHPRIKGALLEIAAMEFDALLTIEEQEDDE